MKILKSYICIFYWWNYVKSGCTIAGFHSVLVVKCIAGMGQMMQ